MYVLHGLLDKYGAKNWINTDLIISGTVTPYIPLPTYITHQLTLSPYRPLQSECYVLRRCNKCNIPRRRWEKLISLGEVTSYLAHKQNNFFFSFLVSFQFCACFMAQPLIFSYLYIHTSYFWVRYGLTWHTSKIKFPSFSQKEWMVK